MDKVKDNSLDKTGEGEDCANELLEEGLCLNCHKNNDKKEQGSRICSECEKKDLASQGEDIAIQDEVDKRLGK